MSSVEISVYRFLYWGEIKIIRGYIDCEIVPLKGDCHRSWRKNINLNVRKEGNE